MLDQSTEILRFELLDRRDKLQHVVASNGPHANLVRLLGEIDTALGKIADGTYGICEVCRGTIEPERLALDPLARTCLDDMTPDERELLERDLDLAYQVQRKLLPRQDLAFGLWKTAYYYEAVGPVSGDYCDMIIPDERNGHLYFFVGDVAGKGVAASILVAQLHAIFHSLVPSLPDVTQLVERANILFRDAALRSHFATLVSGIAFPDGRVEICNAGHCPPIHLHADGTRTIGRTGLPLGALLQSSYTSTCIALQPGEKLVVYTDGLTEAKNSAGGMLGEERLLEEIQTRGRMDASQFVQHIIRVAETHRAGAAKSDDLTVLAIERLE